MKGYWPMLLLLAALWGASYLFIKVAVEDIPPAPMMAVRTLLAAAVLLSYLAWRMGWTRVHLGYAQLALGETQAARAAFAQARQNYDEHYELQKSAIAAAKEWHFGWATCLRGVGRAFALEGEKQQALDALTEALEHYRASQGEIYEPSFLNGLSSKFC